MVSASTGRFPFFLYVFFLLLVVTSPLFAQIFVATDTKHVYGSVVTGEGEPVANATVEIRDLHGIGQGKDFTDANGSFEISTKTGTGQYILLASKDPQVEEARITLDQQDLGVRIAFPACIRLRCAETIASNSVCTAVKHSSKSPDASVKSAQTI